MESTGGQQLDHVYEKSSLLNCESKRCMEDRGKQDTIFVFYVTLHFEILQVPHWPKTKYLEIQPVVHVSGVIIADE